MPEPTIEQMKLLKEGDTCMHCHEVIDRYGKYGLSCGCDSLTIGRAEARNQEIQLEQMKQALRVAEEALKSPFSIYFTECGCQIVNKLENRTCWPCVRDKALTQISPILEKLEER